MRSLRAEADSSVFGGSSRSDHRPEPHRLLHLAESLRVRSAAEDHRGFSIRSGKGHTILEPDDRPALKKAGFLTRDSRIKERKKYGLKKARKAPQYSKR